MGWMTKYFFSRRKKTTKTRRPLISNPHNFQHVGSGAVNFRTSAQNLPRSGQTFRPLELSIYEPSNRVSPLLPYFIGPNSDLQMPQPAKMRDVYDDDSTLLHSRSHSSISFHIPRRPVGDVASYISNDTFDDTPPPKIPPRAKTRPRAYTSPSVEAIVERIASAIIEKDLLDAEIHSLKSRASMCLSRPSTSYDLGESLNFQLSVLLRTSATDFDHVDQPIPNFPVVPPTAPSFAERVSFDRPRTAPSTQTAFPPPPPPQPVPVLPPRRTRPRPPPFPERKSSFKAPQWKPNHAARSASAPETRIAKQAVAASAFNSHPPYTSPKIIDNSIDYSVPLAPPLPLILRPPLRKKKSFSRVSDWLFPNSETDKENTSPSGGAISPFAVHRRHMSIDSVTNAPRALTDKEGYYQTLPPSALFSGPRRSRSFDSASELSQRLSGGSIYSTDEEQTAYGTGTVATSTQAWSPGSTPPEEVRRQAESWKKNEVGLSFAMSVADRVGGTTMTTTTAAASNASETDRGSPVMDEEEEDRRVQMQIRRVPVRIRHQSLQAPRPTSVGVAF